jgi:hypothetical protein
MNQAADQIPVWFPVFFVGMWLTVSTILGLLSGWFVLMRRYPDPGEEPLVRLSGQSGSMGLGVHMNGILSLSACPSGLRVGMWRIFGPFCRPFFVPWSEIELEQKTVLLAQRAKLRFGNPVVGTLSVAAPVWQRLAETGGASTPMPQLPAALSNDAIGRNLALQWLAVTAFASAFFYFGPKFLATTAGGPHPAVGLPPVVCVAFPAIVFGGVFLFRYFAQRRLG